MSEASKDSSKLGNMAIGFCVALILEKISFFNAIAGMFAVYVMAK